MSHKTKQPCDNCGTYVRQGYPLGRNFFCSQGQPVPAPNKPITCLEAFGQPHAAPRRRKEYGPR